MLTRHYHWTVGDKLGFRNTCQQKKQVTLGTCKKKVLQFNCQTVEKDDLSKRSTKK